MSSAGQTGVRVDNAARDGHDTSRLPSIDCSSVSASGAPFPLVISRARPCLRFAPVVAPRRGPSISTSASSEPSHCRPAKQSTTANYLALPHLVHTWGPNRPAPAMIRRVDGPRHREPCATPDAGPNDAMGTPCRKRTNCPPSVATTPMSQSWHDLWPMVWLWPRPSRGPGSHSG